MKAETPHATKGGGEGVKRSSIKLDEKDITILVLLKEDSRKSVRDIAKKTGIRPSTVHLRIQRMVKEGVIEKFTLKLNNKAVGENFIVFMLVKSIEKINENEFKKDCVKEVFGITGEHDLLMKLKFSDIEDFNDYLIKFRERNKVGVTVTMVSTITIKEEL